jgi:hypothetical protein
MRGRFDLCGLGLTLMLGVRGLERRLAEPPADDRPFPSVTAYDDLLGKAMS